MPILVLGIGNLLLGDEGVGSHVVRALQHADLPGHVELVEAGTPGVALVELLAGRRKVVIIDAVVAHTPPGTVLRLGPQDLAPDRAPAISLHELGLPEALHQCRLLGQAVPELVILGVEPERIALGVGLSCPVAEAVPHVVEMVRAEVAG